MSWTSMHFAVGMGCTGLIGGGVSFAARRGWRWLPWAMTLGGFWAIIPDMPRLLREDLVISSCVSTNARDLERWLHDHGNWFFFHKAMDGHPNNYALHGLILMIVLYNAAIGLMFMLERRQRHSIGNRYWEAHADRLQKRRAPAVSKTEATPIPESPEDAVVRQVQHRRAA